MCNCNDHHNVLAINLLRQTAVCCALLPLFIGFSAGLVVPSLKKYVQWLHHDTTYQLAAVIWSLAGDNTYKALFPVSQSHASVIT